MVGTARCVLDNNQCNKDVKMSYSATACYPLAQQKCEVCGCVIASQDRMQLNDLGYSVCRSFECKRVMSQKSVLPPLMFESHLAFNKKLIQQHRDRDAARQQHIDAIKQKEHDENNRVLEAVVASQPDLRVEELHVVVIPSGHGVRVPVDHRRINKYIEHLEFIIAEAVKFSCADEVDYDEHHDAFYKRKTVDQRLVENMQLHRISDRLCTMCKGGCCASGKEHAYLSVFSMRRYMDAHPGLTSEDVVDVYLSKIAGDSIEGSCVNQTLTGCALPRELRSDICNGYYCDSLKSYQLGVPANGSAGQVLAIQRSSTYWNRFEPGVVNEVVAAAIIDEDQQREIDL